MMKHKFEFSKIGDYQGCIPSFAQLKEAAIRYYHFKQYPGDVIWGAHDMIHYVYAPVSIDVYLLNNLSGWRNDHGLESVFH